MKRILRYLASVAVVTTLLVVAEGPAFAQGFVGPNDVDVGPEAPKLSPRSIKLFDQMRSTTSVELSIGPIWARRVQDETPFTIRRNFTRGAPLASEIAIGSVYTTPAQRGPFYLTGHLKSLLRVIDDKSFSWSVFHQELGGGFTLGPFEPEVRVRLGLLTADIIHAAPSIQLFTPGVSAGVGIHVGKFRLDIKAHSEYLWRWFGPDYLIRGVTIGLRFDQPRPKSPFEEETRSSP